MRALINLRSVARLAAAFAVLLSPAPVTAAASTVPVGHAARHYGLCDGHKWSLFGCRTEHPRHRADQPDTDDSPPPPPSASPSPSPSSSVG